MTEAEIIKGCKNNERKAQEELFRKYHPDLLGIGIRYCKNREEAKDILQEVMIKIFENIDQFRGESQLFSWMRRIMINTTITYYHSNVKYKNTASLADLPEAESPETPHVSLEYTKDELLKVLQSLPKEFRIVFNLHAVEGYSHAEIAKLLDISVNTSKTRFFRAKKKLQYKLSKISRENVFTPQHKLIFG